MLLLAHLLTCNNAWRTHKIRLLRTIENEAGLEEVKQHLLELIARSRIPAEPQVIVSSDSVQAIHTTSATAALTLLGFEAPEEGDEDAFYGRMDAFAGEIPRVAFVCSAGNMSLES